MKIQKIMSTNLSKTARNTAIVVGQALPDKYCLTNTKKINFEV